MYDKKMYIETFSALGASENILLEVIKMTKQNKRPLRITRTVLVATVVIMVMALSTAALAATGVLEKLFAVPAPFVNPSDIPTPRPQDISEEEAFRIAQAEIDRVFSTDVSSYDKNAEYGFSVAQNGLDNADWVINIANESYNYLCVLNATTGQISLLHFSDLTKAAEDLDSRHSPLPSDNSYNEAAIAAMSNVESKSQIIGARFYRDGSVGAQVVYWIAVSLDNGDDYLIGIAKDDGVFIGYSYNNGRIDESLFNQ